MSKRQQLKNIAGQFPKVRAAFEMQVEAVSLECIDIAKQISSVIGDISITEAKEVIIREFTKRILEPIIIGYGKDTNHD